MHLFDPHQPYDPPDEFRHAADAGMPFRDARWDTLDAVAREHDGDIPRDILDYVLRLYRGSSLDKPTGEVAALIQHPFYERGSRLRRQRVIRSVAGQPVRPVIVDTDVTGLVDAHWKYIRWGETETLFALKPTPAEGSHVVQTHRAVTEARRASLKQRLAAVGLNLREPGKINRQLLESLRALGYVD